MVRNKQPGRYRGPRRACSLCILPLAHLSLICLSLFKVTVQTEAIDIQQFKVGLREAMRTDHDEHVQSQRKDRHDVAELCR